MGMLSIGATTVQGYMALATAWSICEEMAREHGRQVSRANWRLVVPMHIAETREQALANVRFGLEDWIHYFTEVIALPFKLTGSLEERARQLIESGYAVIGTPDDAVAVVDRLAQQSGGFGCLLQMAHNWADFPQTLRSYELIARYVMPRVTQINENRAASEGWVAAHRKEFMTAGQQAKEVAARKHEAERAARKKSADD